MLPGISDVLAAGNIFDSQGKDMMVEGGIKYNTLGKNINLAWAGVEKETAEEQRLQAVEVYNNNKDLFKRWWDANPQYKGLVPLAVMRMGDTAVDSNEAVLRWIMPTLDKVSKKNKVRAMKAFKLSAVKVSQRKTSNDRKEGRNILDFIEKHNPTTLDGFFDEVIKDAERYKEGKKSDLSLADRSRIFKIVFAEKAGKNDKPKQTPSSPTVKALYMKADGTSDTKNPDRSNFLARKVYEGVGEPSMLKSQKGDVVAIMGIDVMPGSSKTLKASHQNYGWGPKGKIIAFVTNPKNGVDVFPTFFAKSSQMFKKDKKGELPTTQEVADQTGGAFFNDSAMRGDRVKAPVKGERQMTDMDVIIGKLRFAFPSVNVARTAEEFDSIMAEEGIRERKVNGQPVLGITKRGKIWINPDTDTLSTPVHEFGHIWLDYLRDESSGRKGTKLFEKGMSLVDPNSPSYKRALAAYGEYQDGKLINEELVREEALVEMIATKGETIANTAKREEFKSWLNMMYKYIKKYLIDKFKRSKDIKIKDIEALSIEDFTDMAIADLFAGEAVDATSKIKFDPQRKGKARKQIIGEAANLPKAAIDSLGIAKMFEKSGLSSDEIWQGTGWQRGKDGKWRYEIPYGKVKPDALAKILEADGVVSFTLDEVWDAPDLKKAYPALFDKNNPNSIKLDLEIQPDMSQYASYAPGSIEMGVKSAEQLEKSLIHEIQHAVQEIEAFARGGNLSISARLLKTSEKEKALAAGVRYSVAKFLTNMFEMIDTSVKPEVKAKLRASDIFNAEFLLNNFSEELQEVFDVELEGLTPEEATKDVEANESGAKYVKGIGLKNLTDKTPQQLAKLLAEGIEQDFKEENKIADSTEAYELVNYDLGTGADIDVANRDYQGVVETFSQLMDEYLDEWSEYSNYNLYQRLAGETEARNAEMRSRMPQGARRSRSLESTEDISRDKQIVISDEVAKRIGLARKEQGRMRLGDQTSLFGEPIPPRKGRTQRKRGEMPPPEPTDREIVIGEFIEEKRDAQYTDSDIKKLLKTQFKDITTDEIKKALDVDTSVYYSAKTDKLFEQLFMKMPQILKDMRFSRKVFADKKGVKNKGQGGVRIGEVFIDQLQKLLDAYTSEEQRTLIQVRTEVGRLVRNTDLYKSLSETEKKEFLLAVDEMFGITEGEVLNARMKQLKTQITNRKLGKGELRRDQRTVAKAIKDLFPNEVRMPKEWKKLLTNISDVTTERIKTTMEKLVDLVGKQIEKAKIETLKKIKVVVNSGGQLRRNPKTNKNQSVGKVSADMQSFFAEAKVVLKAALLKDEVARNKALNEIAKTLYKGEQVIETITYTDAYGNPQEKKETKTIYSPSNRLEDLESALEAESLGYPLTMAQKKLVYRETAFAMLSNIRDLDIAELTSLYKALSDKKRIGRKELLRDREERSKKNFDLKLKARREVAKIFGNLVMSEISNPYQPIPKQIQERYINVIAPDFDDLNPQPATRTKLVLEKDEYGNYIQKEVIENIEGAEQVEIEIEGEKLKIYRQSRKDAEGNLLKPKFSVLMSQPSVALTNEQRTRYPEFKEFMDRGKYTEMAKNLTKKFRENPTAMLNPLGYLGNLEGMTQLLDRPAKSDTQFFYKEIKERVDKMTSDANRGFVEMIAKMDEFVRTSFAPKRILGTKTLKDLTRLESVVKYYKVPMADGNTGIFSGSQLMRIYALSKNEEQLRKMMSHRKEFRVTQETLDFITGDKGLPNEVLSFVDKVVEFLSGPYYESINNVYKKVNYLNLGWIPNYFPTLTDALQARSTFKALGEGDFVSIFNAQYQTAVKARFDKTGEVILKGEGFFAALENHFREMEKFKAMAEPVQDLNAIMSEAAVTTAMEKTGMLRFINFNLNATINPRSVDLGDRSFIDGALRIFVNYTLGSKAIQFIKQATSSIFAYKMFRVFKDSDYAGLRFIDKTPLGDMIDFGMFTLRMLGILARPIKSIKRAKLLSSNFKLRWDNTDLYDLEASSGVLKKTLKSPKSMWRNPIGALFQWHNAALTLQNIWTKWGDAAGVLGYLALYDQLKANGKSDEQALKAFEKYDATQQTRRTQDLSKLQLQRDFLSRLSVTFGSMGFLQLNNALPSIRNLISSLTRGKMPSKEDTRGLFLNMFIGNFLFHLAANTYLIATGDEDDDEKTAFSRIAWGTLMGTITMGIPIAGAALETFLKTVVSDEPPKKAAKEQINPFLEFGKRLYRAYNKDVWARDQAEIASIITGTFTGLQVEPLIGAIAFAKELGYGPEEEGIPRLTDNLGKALGITYSSRPKLIEGKATPSQSAMRYIKGDDFADMNTAQEAVIEAQLEYMDSLQGISQKKYEAQEKLRRQWERQAGDGYQNPWERAMHKAGRAKDRVIKYLKNKFK